MPLKTTVVKLRNRLRIAAYRYRLPVREVLLFSCGDAYPICPRCGSMLEREYVRFCDCCGQRLAWQFLDSAAVIHAPRE